MRRISYLVLFFLILTGFQAKAGWVITEQTKNQFGNKTFQTTFIQSHYLRFDTPTLVSILNLKNNKITLLFPQDKAYWEGTAADLKEQFHEIMAKQLRLMIQHAPEKQKDTLEKAYEHFISQKNDTLSAQPKVVLKKTGLTATMLKHPVQQYDIMIDSVLLEKVWVTQSVKPYADVDLQKALKLSNAINPLSSRQSIPVTADYLSLLKNGVVLERTFYERGQKPKVLKVTEVRKVKIIETLFEIPANYVLMDIEQVMHMDMGRDILNPKFATDKEKRIQLSLPPPFKVNKKAPHFDGDNR
jgi:hypothetical protein